MVLLVGIFTLGEGPQLFIRNLSWTVSVTERMDSKFCPVTKCLSWVGPKRGENFFSYRKFIPLLNNFLISLPSFAVFFSFQSKVTLFIGDRRTLMVTLREDTDSFSLSCPSLLVGPRTKWLSPLSGESLLLRLCLTLYGDGVNWVL